MLANREVKVIFPDEAGLKRIKLCVASDNDFIPIYVLKESTAISSTKIAGKKDLTYYFSFTSDSEHMRKTAKYVNFIDRLFNDSHYFIEITKENLPKDRKYVVTNHSLFEVHNDVVTPLFLLCIKYKYLHTVDKRNPDFTQFSLVVNNELINNPVHIAILRQIERSYFKVVRDHFDFVYTNNIMKICFNNNFKIPKFNTVKEMLNHFNDLNFKPDVVKPTVADGQYVVGFDPASESSEDRLSSITTGIATELIDTIGSTQVASYQSLTSERLREFTDALNFPNESSVDAATSGIMQMADFEYEDLDEEEPVENEPAENVTDNPLPF